MGSARPQEQLKPQPPKELGQHCKFAFDILVLVPPVAFVQCSLARLDSDVLALLV